MQREKEKGPQRETGAEGDAAEERGWLIDAGTGGSLCVCGGGGGGGGLGGGVDFGASLISNTSPDTV